MLKKVLKYDFRSVFRYWWIAAVSSLVLSLLGSACMCLLNSERALPTVVEVSAILVLILVFLSYGAFVFLSLILIFLRFYKNFFTDEGYLTFTLPVRRSQLLNSKLIMSVVAIIGTYIVCGINLVVMCCIGFSKDVFTQEFWNGLAEGWKILVGDLGIYVWIYLLEILALLILSTIFTCLFLFCCVTFAAIITKKAKVIAAIGIYYGASTVFSFVVEILMLFAIPSFTNWVSKVGNMENPLFALGMLGLIFFMAIFCMLLYTLQYWMIDRKLNLS